jgi:hypothetical protein
LFLCPSPVVERKKHRVRGFTEKGWLMRGRFMEVQAREEVRCMLKRSACLGSWCVQEAIQEFRRSAGFGVMNQ